MGAEYYSNFDEIQERKFILKLQDLLMNKETLKVINEDLRRKSMISLSKSTNFNISSNKNIKLTLSKRLNNSLYFGNGLVTQILEKMKSINYDRPKVQKIFKNFEINSKKQVFFF